MKNNIFFDVPDVKRLLPVRDCITVMKQSLMELSKQSSEVLNPLRQAIKVPFLKEKTGLLGSMPAMCASYMDKSYISNKVITVYPGNKNVGRSSHQGVVILFDAEFGDLLCICDASAITAQRTAAVSALAVQTFAPKHKKNLVITIMGTGEQAISHVESINSCSLSDRISKIQIWGRSEQSCIECKDHIKNQINIDVHIVLDAKEAVTSADVICTVTASRAPIVKGEWLRAGHTVIAVGACTPNARELDSKTIQTCKFFYDCKESVLNECGEYLIALEEGAVTSDGLCGEIGEVLNGNKEGRSNDDDIIVFKSLGVGIEDLFSAAYIYNNYSL